MPTPSGSTLTFLHKIPTFPPNTKVRFLGCITAYSPTTGILTLTHPPSPISAKVDISILATSLSMGDIRNGEWFHVIGYTPQVGVDDGVVHAVMLLSARGVDLGGYEKRLKEMLEVQGWEM